jgi:hypothetical protein
VSGDGTEADGPESADGTESDGTESDDVTVEIAPSAGKFQQLDMTPFLAWGVRLPPDMGSIGLSLAGQGVRGRAPYRLVHLSIGRRASRDT